MQALALVELAVDSALHVRVGRRPWILIRRNSPGDVRGVVVDGSHALFCPGRRGRWLVFALAPDRLRVRVRADGPVTASVQAGRADPAAPTRTALTRPTVPPGRQIDGARAARVLEDDATRRAHTGVREIDASLQGLPALAHQRRLASPTGCTSSTKAGRTQRMARRDALLLVTILVLNTVLEESRSSRDNPNRARTRTRTSSRPISHPKIHPKICSRLRAAATRPDQRRITNHLVKAYLDLHRPTLKIGVHPSRPSDGSPRPWRLSLTFRP